MGPILVTGGSGQVGGALERLAPAEIEIFAPGRSELDLTVPSELTAMVRSRPWAAIVNCAAYTAVDRAETDVVAAWQVNALAPAALAAAAKAADIPIIHVSTDYVFDGTKRDFYGEDDPVAPVGVYGASKEGGEQAIRTAAPRHVILRTAWVVSATGANFVKTMFRLGAERPQLRVVADQRGCPTSADDIARAILHILGRIEAGPYGTYHFVNGGEATWYALAEAVFARAATHGRPSPSVEPILTSDYPTPAARPANSRLSTAKIGRDYGITPRDWRGAIDEIVDALVKDQA
ncbi:MAG TPA: dTDP-4-dehydrorhamnose reductase [Sphingomonas sp.]|uniref:dTDP-4-dehydrorhamnose reductase n=1 Tax=Sphingomonas sp. TaxID=28214 RepID=UPI002BD3476A|nr:dTDP-4-dehydrorhamnose reductase [Sphingomonas sp.]HMI20048.1 dTDP-4-dehydrorhamnose reductase [Sphingomonas sp.]